MHDTAKCGGYLESIMKERERVQLEYEEKLQMVESEYKGKLQMVESEYEGKLQRIESESRRRLAEELLSLYASDQYVSGKTNLTVY